MRIQDLLERVEIDNMDGLGAVPKNQDVDYFGLRVNMRPSVFLNLAAKFGLGAKDSKEHIISHLKNSGAIGAPFLMIELPDAWGEKDFTDPARVGGHEGRHRMLAVQDVHGDAPIEVHLFFRGEVRARHITEDHIKHLNKGMYKEEHASDIFVSGPLFSV